MVLLEIKANILSYKHFEFSQTKLAFISDLQKASGYLDFKEQRGEQFHIIISWADRQSLNDFLGSEVFSFFRGAIVTLGSPDSLIINQN
jgi:hypothetical protein